VSNDTNKSAIISKRLQGKHPMLEQTDTAKEEIYYDQRSAKQVSLIFKFILIY